MKLCEHIALLYRNEINRGNEPLYISTPSCVDKSATANIYVIMKNKLQDYQIDGIEEHFYLDYHFPRERYYGCSLCNHYISGPMEENQTNWFKYSHFDTPNSKIIATKNNIYIEDGVYGKSMIPLKELI